MTTLVLIPTYNERENLPIIVERVLRHDNVRVMVIDDGSPDGTGAIADQLATERPGQVAVMHRTGARGLGRSYRDGFRVAVQSDADFVCQMDADLSHNPVDIPRLIAATANAEFAIGSRYVPGGRIENWPARRRMLSAFANRYIRAITKLTIRDCTSGFRCWRREALEQLPLASIRSDGYSFIVELAWEAAKAGFRCGEIPITFVERRRGASKLSARVIVESAILPWRLAARPK